jgi:hypothetical protein
MAEISSHCPLDGEQLGGACTPAISMLRCPRCDALIVKPEGRPPIWGRPDEASTPPPRPFPGQTEGATAWGTKDFYIDDPDGHIIAFGGRPSAHGASQEHPAPERPPPGMISST